MILPALLAFGAAGFALAWAEDHLHRRSHAPFQTAWVDYFLLPLGRVFALALFVLLAYPQLFGRHDAPALRDILFGVQGRADRLITVLFLTGLLLPSLPGLRRMPGLTLPLQGMAGVALLFAWTAQALGADVSVFPASAQCLALGALGALAAGLARLMTAGVGEPVVRQDLQDLLLLWLQAPILLVYGRMLGAHLV